jgi:hypothetical protein
MHTAIPRSFASDWAFTCAETLDPPKPHGVPMNF